MRKHPWQVIGAHLPWMLAHPAVVSVWIRFVLGTACECQQYQSHFVELLRPTLLDDEALRFLCLEDATE
ncbi:hypothetical protein D3C86_2068230 [compost metagenome]